MRTIVILVGLIVVSILAAVNSMPLIVRVVPASRESPTIGLGLMAGVALLVLAGGALIAPWRLKSRKSRKGIDTAGTSEH